MTNKEAMNWLGLEVEIWEAECKSIHPTKDALKMAIESIKFRIPESVEDYHHCPNCGYGLPAKGITDKWCDCCYEWKYCPECGQALDWSRKNEVGL